AGARARPHRPGRRRLRPLCPDRLARLVGGAAVGRGAAQPDVVVRGLCIRDGGALSRPDRHLPGHRVPLSRRTLLIPDSQRLEDVPFAVEKRGGSSSDSETTPPLVPGGCPQLKEFRHVGIVGLVLCPFPRRKPPWLSSGPRAT